MHIGNVANAIIGAIYRDGSRKIGNEWRNFGALPLDQRQSVRKYVQTTATPFSDAVAPEGL